MRGLVLTAGGARGAYQAGVLQRIGQIPALRARPSPFAIVTGASAGAINGTMVAATSDDFQQGTAALADLWRRLTVTDVFRADALSLGRNAARLVTGLVTGGWLGGAGTHALFDASPLQAFLRRTLPVEGIASAIRRGDLYALAVTSTSYHSGRSYTFVQGRRGHPLWRKSRRVTIATNVTAEHVYASAAIPIIFPPGRLQGEGPDLWFGDGGLRLVTPFSPAIRLGASRVLAIGIRSHDAARELALAELGAHPGGVPWAGGVRLPPLAQICGVFLNAIFLDHLDTDLDHLLRMNDLIRTYAGAVPPMAGVPQEPMRTIAPLVVNPSEDLALVASTFAYRMPRLVRHLMDGLGTPDARSADLMSYLLFDGRYTGALVDIGYRDASRRIDEIEAFLCDDVRTEGAGWTGAPSEGRLAAG